ncbi:MAG: MotA/TolQ/ExbB proton channel family protein [Desulfuromonadaceae bacterium]|nr:MotA/TolQ/ExbB proton channel family protein [Desulfuromonadaceae bacterium]
MLIREYRWRKVLVAVLISCGLGLGGTPAHAQDARARLQTQDEVVGAAVAHASQVKQQVEALRRELEQDKQGVMARLTSLRSTVTEVERISAQLEGQVELRRAALKKQKELEAEENQRHVELLGSIRTSTADVAGMVKNSPVTALSASQSSVLQHLLAADTSASIAQVRTLRTLMLEQIQAAAQVQRQSVTIVDRSGKQVEAQVVLLGTFTALYKTDAEVGFALYSPPSRQLMALSQLPSYILKKQIKNYFSGNSNAAPIDIGHGASLRQMTYQRNLRAQVRYGGVIVWPILGIAVVALVLVGERIWFLSRQRYDSDAILAQIQPCIDAHQWEECEQLCQRWDVPLARVLAAGIPFVTRPREELENVLQEEILAEIPAQERFLSTLAVLAAIAPLLGLLGTVTGMIHTFELITFHGTGDPRMLSSGISEALVTTMFGLGVAIPLMLAHSLISRRVESHIAELEEKAISFVNRVIKALQPESSVATQLRKAVE